MQAGDCGQEGHSGYASRDGGRDAGGGGAVLGWAGMRRGGGDLGGCGRRSGRM